MVQGLNELYLKGRWRMKTLTAAALCVAMALSFYSRADATANFELLRQFAGEEVDHMFIYIYIYIQVLQVFVSLRHYQLKVFEQYDLKCFFYRSIFCSPSLHLFDSKYSSEIVNYLYYLK